jgi:ABC-type molybdate transport system substrate-binding protein
MSAINPGLSPEFMKTIKERQKADALAAKRQKELAALTKKQTQAVKEQTALAKAKAVLDKANAVFNLDLIQNTAALQGKITEDESLRLRLQREILLGNADASAKLAQELLSVQIAAMMAASVDPFGNYAKSALEAMKALQEVRNGLASLGTPRIITGAEQLSIDEAAALADAINPEFAMLDRRGGPINGGYSQYDTSLTATELRIFIDPSAAQYGIGVASVNNSANGNSNNYSTIQSFAGGM